MPLPRSLKRAPGCVPAGILSSSSAFIVGTRTSPPRDGQKSLLEPELAGSAALAAHLRRAARRRARAAARLAGFFARYLDGGFGPFVRLLERDLEIVAKIGAALRAAAPPAAAEDVA